MSFTIGPLSAESIGDILRQMRSGLGINDYGNTVWPTANRALFIPFRVYTPMVLRRAAICVGTPSSGNLDIGVYTRDGTRLVSSGSTAMAPAFSSNEVALTATPVGVGLYYMAVAVDNATAQLYAYTFGGANYGVMAGMAQMASAFPLPATATFAQIAVDFVPAIVVSSLAGLR